MTVEQQLYNLERESDAMKSAFTRTAYKMPIYTKTKSFNTNKNQITSVFSGGSSTTVNSVERVLVSFNTKKGMNTIAKIELTSSNPNLPVVRRTNFSGGAQWTLTAEPDVDELGGNYKPTTYNIMVQSFLDGDIVITEPSS